MFLYCYARSGRARSTGDRLLSGSEGEWIDNMENFVSVYGNSNRRADAAIVLILPQEACVKLLLERICPADIRCPVFNVTPDGKYAGILKPAGYNTHQMLSKITEILGSTALSSEDDRRDFAPDLKRAVMAYRMKPDSEELLDEISEFISLGGAVDVYSDLPLELSEPVLDTVGYRLYGFGSNQRKELGQAFVSANSEDRYSVFITCGSLPDTDRNGKVLVLVPRIVVLGLEISSKADPEYSARIVREALMKHSINPDAVVTVAVSALARESEVVKAVAEDIGCFVTFFDSRLLKAVRVPLNGGFTTEKISADYCTAAACLASDNGRILLRRAGDNNSVLMTASLKRSTIMLTD